MVPPVAMAGARLNGVMASYPDIVVGSWNGDSWWCSLKPRQKTKNTGLDKLRKMCDIIALQETHFTNGVNIVLCEKFKEFIFINNPMTRRKAGAAILV